MKTRGEGEVENSSEYGGARIQTNVKKKKKVTRTSCRTQHRVGEIMFKGTRLFHNIRDDSWFSFEGGEGGQIEKAVAADESVSPVNRNDFFFFSLYK